MFSTLHRLDNIYSAPAIIKHPHSPQASMHIFLDIDGTLAMCEPSTVSNHYHLYKELKAHNAKITALFKHYLYPGTIEFIQWLFQIPQAKISFFSAGTQDRNDLFVDELLKKAFGHGHKKIKENVLIFSKDNMLNDILTNKPKKNLKKALTLAHISINFLKNAILIDDNASYVATGEERNGLIVPNVHRDSTVEQHILFINHIFYITGLLKTIMNSNDSLSVNLFKLQYKDLSNHFYKSRVDEMHVDKYYYEEGLRELQKINPNLHFYHPTLFNDYFDKEEEALCEKISKLKI